MGNLGGDTLDRCRGNAGLLGGAVRRITRLQAALGEKLEGGNRAPSVGQRHRAGKARHDAVAACIDRSARRVIDDKRAPVAFASEQAVIGGAFVLDDEPGRIGVADKVFLVDLAGAQQLVDEGENFQLPGERRGPRRAGRSVDGRL